MPSEPAPAVEAPQQQPVAPVLSTTPATTPIAPAPTTTSPPRDETKYQKNKPPEQPPTPKRTARPANPAPAAAVPQGPAPIVNPPADSPRLGDVLTAEQQHQYNAAIDQSLARAQTSLGAITNRQLTKEQEATVAQVQNFIQQALEKRKEELAAAKSLAERAEVLAHDLLASLR